MRIKIFVALLSCTVVSISAFADAQVSTLRKIKETGTITVGHRESSVPFSYYDQQENAVGYSYELMMRVVDSIKRELGMHTLIVKTFPVTPLNRIPLIQNGAIDIECSTTTNNSERQKQVSFSNTFFVATTKLLTKKNSGVKDFPDLAGKSVVTNAGTTSEQMLHRMNDKKHMKINIISVKDHQDAVLAVQNGLAAAYMMDDALLYGQRAKTKKPEEWLIVGRAQSYEPYGCLMRKGDGELKRMVDTALVKLMKSGEIDEIYNKWFMEPIPSQGLNLNFPMSEETRNAFRNPNDKAFD